MMSEDSSKIETAQFWGAVAFIVLVVGVVGYAWVAPPTLFELLASDLGAVVKVAGVGFVVAEVLDYFSQAQTR